MNRPRLLLSLGLGLGVLGAVAAVRSARADDAAPAAVTRPGTAAARTFATREEAAKAIVDALERNDDAALRAIVGTDDADLVQSGADEAVRRERLALASEARRKTGFDEQSDGRVLVTVGDTDYPLAMPLVRDGDRWKVDVEAGRRELLARRIGEHEIEAIGTCLAYADAQEEYAKKDRDGDGVREYAQRLRSTPGTHDGLWWDASEGEEESPAGPDLSPLKDALEPAASRRTPFNGYYWRILSAQGPSAPGGPYTYVVNGNMVAGYALLAVPAVWRNTGVKSFLVSRHGKVYEKDLGPDTLRIGGSILAFDPDPSWRELDERTIRIAAGTRPEDAPFLEGAEVSPAVPLGSKTDVPATADPAGPGRDEPCPKEPVRR
jgi:hypothetical protein